MRGGFVLGLLFYLATGPAAAQSPPAYTPEQLTVAFAKGWRPLQPPPEYDKPYTGELTVYRAIAVGFAATLILLFWR